MGSMALQLKPFTVPDPIETYGRALTLRDMMDQRRYRAIQERQAALREQQLQQQIAEQEREREDVARFQRNLPNLPKDATLEQTVELLGPGQGYKFYKTQQEAKEAAAKRAKEELEAADKRRLLFANKAEAYLSEPDLARRQRMYEIDTPDFLRLGIITPEQAKDPLGDDTALEAIVAAGKGREYKVKLKGDIAKQTEDRAEAGRKTFDEKLDLFGRVLGYVKTPEQWSEVVDRVPVELSRLFPRTITAEQLPALLRQATEMTMTPKERQEAAPKTLAEWQRISVDPAYSPVEQKIADRMVKELGRGQISGREAKLRDDYRADKDVQNYVVRRDSMTEIQSAMLDEGGISDIKLVYNYIKMSDPGSVVKQDEKSMVESAASIPDRVRNLIPALFRGEKLPPEIRKDILREAKKTYAQALANYNQRVKNYRDISERDGVDPRNVLIDYSPATPGIQTAQGTTVTPAAPPGAPPATPVMNPTVEDVDRELSNPQLSPPRVGPPVGPQREVWEDGPDGVPRRVRK